MQALCESSQWCIPANRLFFFFFAPPCALTTKSSRTFCRVLGQPRTWLPSAEGCEASPSRASALLSFACTVTALAPQERRDEVRNTPGWGNRSRTILGRKQLAGWGATASERPSQVTICKETRRHLSSTR